MNSGTDRYGIAIWDRLAFAEQHWDVTGETDLPAILSGRPCSPISLGGLADANFLAGTSREHVRAIPSYLSVIRISRP